jgi:polyisoprenoid-binding protein YceI/rhodanese-related sulfurtransferase
MMTALQLQQRLAQSGAPLLIHVLPEEVFIAQRIPRSVNVCVYEMAFISKVQELQPDASVPIVLYGAGAGSLDAEVAGEKLTKEGFTAVEIFAGGLAEWVAEKLPLEGTGEIFTGIIPHGVYRVDLEQSVIRWTGRNLFNHHSGTVKLAGGQIELKHGELAEGRFSIDMSSISCEDLADSAWNAMLIQHLKDADFFDLAHYPTADFTMEGITYLYSVSEGSPRHKVQGQLTLRGVTRPICFPMVVADSEGGRRLTAQAQFEIDRTEFGSLYGSGKFFRYLGKHIVNDHIHLHVKLHVNRV